METNSISDGLARAIKLRDELGLHSNETAGRYFNSEQRDYMLRCKESRIGPLEMATAIGVNPARVENYLYNHELYSKDKRNKKLKIQTIN